MESSGASASNHLHPSEAPVTVPGIRTPSPLWATGTVNGIVNSAVTSTPPAAASTQKAGAERHAVSYLTDSDKSLLLNSLGVTMTAGTTAEGADFIGMTVNPPVSDDEWAARMNVASQIMMDRKYGQLRGEVTPGYLTDLLTRYRDSGADTSMEVVLSKALDYLSKGTPATRVDTQA